MCLPLLYLLTSLTPLLLKNMLFIDWQPSLEVFSIGSFALRWYSLLWCIGLAFAYTIVHRLYKQQKIDEKKFGQLIQEEINRINAEKGTRTTESTD